MTVYSQNSIPLVPWFGYAAGTDVATALKVVQRQCDFSLRCVLCDFIFKKRGNSNDDWFAIKLMDSQAGIQIQIK